MPMIGSTREHFLAVFLVSTVLGSAATTEVNPGCMRLRGGSDFALLEKKSNVIAADYEIGKFKCDFKMQSAGAEFTPSYTREAYNQIVGTVSGRKSLGPLSLSATVDPEHKIRGEAELQSLGNRIAVKQSFVPGEPLLATNPVVMMDTRLPFFGGSLSASASSQIENPFSDDSKFLGWRSAFGQDVDLSVAISQGDLLFGASSTLSPATDKYSATSRNSKAGFKWKGLGVMFYTPKSLEHLAGAVQNEVDHLLVPLRNGERDPDSLWPIRLSGRIPESVRIPSIMRDPSLADRGAKPAATVTDSGGLAEQVTLTVEKSLGATTLAGAYSSADKWTAGLGTRFGSDLALKGRIDAQNRGAGVLSARLADNAHVRLSCEVLVTGTLQDMLDTRRLGLHFIFGAHPPHTPAPTPAPPPKPLATEQPAKCDRPMPGIKQVTTTHSQSAPAPAPSPWDRQPHVPETAPPASAEGEVEIPPVRTLVSQLRDKVLALYNSNEAKPLRDAVSRTTGTAFQFAAPPAQTAKQCWETTVAPLLPTDAQKDAFVGEVEARTRGVASFMGDATQQLGAVVAETTSQVGSRASQLASSPAGQTLQGYWAEASALLPVAEQQKNAFVGQLEANARVVACFVDGARQKLGVFHRMFGEKLQIADQ